MSYTTIRRSHCCEPSSKFSVVRLAREARSHLVDHGASIIIVIAESSELIQFLMMYCQRELACNYHGRWRCAAKLAQVHLRHPKENHINNNISARAPWLAYHRWYNYVPNLSLLLLFGKHPMNLARRKIIIINK